AVERALARLHDVIDPAPVERRLERALSEVPLLVRADLLVRPGRELEARLHPEQVIEVRREIEAAEDLPLDLLRRAEDVSVVLGDVTDAQQAVQRARELVSVERRRFRVPQRETAARPRCAARADARTAAPANAPTGGRDRAFDRAHGGRASAPPRAAGGTRRGLPWSRKRSRRSASTAAAWSRRASTRRPAPSA